MWIPSPVNLYPYSLNKGVLPFGWAEGPAFSSMWKIYKVGTETTMGEKPWAVLTTRGWACPFQRTSGASTSTGDLCAEQPPCGFPSLGKGDLLNHRCAQPQFIKWSFVPGGWFNWDITGNIQYAFQWLVMLINVVKWEKQPPLSDFEIKP